MSTISFKVGKVVNINMKLGAPIVSEMIEVKLGFVNQQFWEY